MIKPTYVIFYTLSSEVWTPICKGILLLCTSTLYKAYNIFYSPGLQENSSTRLGTHFLTIIQLTLSSEFGGPPLVLGGTKTLSISTFAAQSQTCGGNTFVY